MELGAGRTHNTIIEDMNKRELIEETRMMMKQYTGTKTIKATPMTRGVYNELRGWKVPDDENPSDEGYIVEYPDSKSNVEGFTGYISWSPVIPFENAYKPSGTPLERMEIELSDLGSRIQKARKFLLNPIGTDGEDRCMLSMQLSHMVAYHEVLAQRINRMKKAI